MTAVIAGKEVLPFLLVRMMCHFVHVYQSMDKIEGSSKNVLWCEYCLFYYHHLDTIIII